MASPLAARLLGPTTESRIAQTRPQVECPSVTASFVRSSAGPAPCAPQRPSATPEPSISLQQLQQVEQAQGTARLSAKLPDEHDPERSDSVCWEDAQAISHCSVSGGSHTLLHFPSSAVQAYGVYRVHGPAVLRKCGDQLVAYLLEGSRLELFDGDPASGGWKHPVTLTHKSLLSKHEPLGSSASVESTSSVNLLPVFHLPNVFCSHHTAPSAPGPGANAPHHCHVGSDGAGFGALSKIQYAGMHAMSELALPADPSLWPAPDSLLCGVHVELTLESDSELLREGPDGECVMPGLHKRFGRAYLAVRSLPEDAAIVLSAQEQLAHPVVVVPQPLPQRC